MDILPSGNIFRELQDIQDFGYFSSQSSIEDQWQQASVLKLFLLIENLRNSSLTQELKSRLNLPSQLNFIS